MLEEKPQDLNGEPGSLNLWGEIKKIWEEQK
jgi:hypothetical protein